MIRYTASLEGIMDGWGWPNPPDAATLYRVLEGSYRICLAVDDDSEQVVGSIHAISDGVLAGEVAQRAGGDQNSATTANRMSHQTYIKSFWRSLFAKREQRDLLLIYRMQHLLTRYNHIQRSR